MHIESKGDFNINGSLSESIGFWAIKDEGKYTEICKSLKKDLKFDESVYNLTCIYQFSAAGCWEKVEEYVKMGKKSPCPMKAIAEICIHFNKRDLARTIFVEKISDVDEKILLLIEFSFWEDAIKIVFATKK